MNKSSDANTTAASVALQRGLHEQLAEWRSTVQATGLRLGWKLGFSERRAQQRVGLTAPAIGYLRSDLQLRSGESFPVPAQRVVKAEVEVAIRMGCDVAAGATTAAAEAAIAAYAPAVELVDVTRRLDGLEALLRGNLYHAAVLIGPEKKIINPRSAREVIQARFYLNDQPAGECAAPHLPEHFAEWVQSTAETLDRHGEQLIAGDWIICGAILEPQVVTAGQRIAVDMTGFERITLEFTDA